MTSSQIVKITTIATMWYSIYWMHTLTKKHNLITRSMMEDILDIKVSKTVRDVGEGNYLVEDILNRKVSKTEEYISRRAESVDEVLNQK